MRKFIYHPLFVLVFLNVRCTANKDEETQKPPNILFAIADDASWKNFGAYGCNWVNTPAFDRVANEGILFNNAYTPNAKSAPSRACILTGRNSWQLEEAVNHSPFFPSKFKTYTETLGENGYWVGSVAKGWAPGDPGEINGKKRELTGPKFNEYKLTAPTKHISNNDYSKNFEAFLEARPKGQPFCFWYGSLEPHRGYEFRSGINKGGKNINEIDEVPAFWPDVDTVRIDMLDYAFEIEHFDNHLKIMLEKLDEIGELENTIVIVTSDHGMPFPRAKGQVYEYSNHVPLAIMWLNGIKNPGRVIDDFVSFIDLAPTYFDVAKINGEEKGMQPLTGNSLTDIFYSEKERIVNPERNFVLVGKERHDVGRPDDQGYPVRGIMTDGFLYLHNFKTDRWPVGNPETGYLNCDGSPTKTYILNAQRHKGEMKYWQLNFGKRPEEELYDIVKDPYCVNNLAGNKDFFLIKSKLKKGLEAKLREQDDPRILGNGDIFDNYEYAGGKDYYNRFMAGEVGTAGWVNETDYDSDLTKE